MSKYLMAIDAGTGSVRAVIFDLNGNQLGVAQHEWEHKGYPEYPGSMDFDVKYNWQLTVDCIRTVLSSTGISSSDIAAISTTSMREGIVLYDENGEEIWACANVDSRAGAEVEELIAKDLSLERALYKISGQTFALGALPRILWVKKYMPEIYNKVKTITMLNDWLIYKLSGVLSVEPSNGCTTGMFNLEKRNWQPEISKKCGLKDDIFPSIFESGSVVGNVSESCSLITGLSTSTLVVAGGGDAQLGTIGVGAVLENQIAVLGGSFWQLECNTIIPKTDNHCRIRINCHAVPGLFQYEAIAFFPGLVMRWYRDGFCQLEKQIAQQINEDPYMLMDKEAEQIPAGSYGMMCAFSDVMNYISWKHASPTFTNFALDAEKFNRYTFYRSLLENAALVTKGHLEMVIELTGNRPTEIIFANGASKSKLWCQIMADVLGVNVKVPKVKEATALGAAICAGVGAGIYESIESASSALVLWDHQYTPNPENQKTYDKLFKSWKQMYSAQLKISDNGITEYMWKAPGL
ncbi:autoinducer-2 kinase [Geosporobacter ferrireducens]|uniref:Autoinducer-2 kinase n=1 Tax=Geosporobacter ferrireducens TaxID=1424294 RepID=A0A1D8GKZ5_9FIRM|nr:autoinducer-2 kinase [Geosporobacter ferrireducens]AOT71568.1 autoinducer-2 kinase [Geosporobacter ferrireducens]MTI57881.1 autoinducer-2 kinase [Geosporobacter ferrireducens]